MSDVFSVTWTVTWDMLHRDAALLAARLRMLGPFTGIVAVARGGLVPAAIVARTLDIRIVDTICVASYDDRKRGDLRVLKPVAGDGASLLIVDDLADTGITARVTRAMLPKAHFATVYAKPAGKALVDTFVTEINQDTWIQFPWDAEPQIAPS